MIRKSDIRFVATLALCSLTTAMCAAYGILWAVQGPVALLPFTVCMLGAATVVGAVLLTLRALAVRKERKRQAAARKAEASAVLYWSGPFSQPQHDRVELTAYEDYQIMEWENAEREQINRMLGY